MSELHEAILYEDLVTIENLLSDGENPNELDDDGNSPLELTENEEIINLLLSYGALHDPDYYFGMRYHAYYDLVNYFDDDLKNEIVDKLKVEYQTDLQNVINEDIEAADDGILFDLKLLGIKSINNGQIKHSEDYISTYEINDLLERLEYIVEYEGSDNPIEGMTGVYFIE